VEGIKGYIRGMQWNICGDTEGIKGYAGE